MLRHLQVRNAANNAQTQLGAEVQTQATLLQGATSSILGQGKQVDTIGLQSPGLQKERVG